MKLKTVEEAYRSILTGGAHMDFVHVQVEQSSVAMKSLLTMARMTVEQDGSITESKLLQTIAAAMGIGIKIGLEMASAVSPIVTPGGIVQ